jgi:hypothetical protein
MRVGARVPNVAPVVLTRTFSRSPGTEIQACERGAEAVRGTHRDGAVSPAVCIKRDRRRRLNVGVASRAQQRRKNSFVSFLSRSIRGIPAS